MHLDIPLSMASFLRIYLLLLFNFFLVSKVLSSPAEKDSLLKVLSGLRPSGYSFQGDTIKIKILCELGRQTKSISEAEGFFKNALDLSTNIHWKHGEYLSQYLLGKMYNKNGKYIEAVNFFYKSLFLAEQSNNTIKQADCLGDLADAYSLLGQYSQAIVYYNKAAEIFKIQNKIPDYVDCLNNLSMVYYDRKEFDMALNLLYQCQSNGTSLRGTIAEAGFLSNIGSCYREKNNLDSAVLYFDRSLKVYSLNEGKHNDLLAITILEKAKTYLLFNQKEKAIELGLLAYKLNSKYYGNNLSVTLFLSDLYKVKGDYEKAFLYFREYSSALQDAQKQDKIKQIESLKYEYDNKQNKARIDLLNTENEQKSFQRKLLLSGLLFLFLCLVLSIRNFRILKRKNLKIDLQRQELGRVTGQLEKINATLETQVTNRTYELTEANKELVRKNKEIEEALFNGQNIERKRVASELHDNLGSTISGLIWQLDGMAMETEIPQLHSTYVNLVDKMREAYTEIRHISHNLYPSELARYGLDNSIQRLTDNLNKNNRIEFSYESTGQDLNCSKHIELELYAVCLELLNNVIKHSEANRAKITLGQQNNAIMLRVCDNGIGLGNGFNTKGGKGFANILNRVNSVNGQLNFDMVDNWTCISAIIPFSVGSPELKLKDSAMD